MSLCFTLCHSRGARASLPPIPEIALQIIQTREGVLLSGVSMFINIQTIWSKWLLSKSCKYAREHEHHEHWQISKYVEFKLSTHLVITFSKTEQMNDYKGIATTIIDILNCVKTLYYFNFKVPLKCFDASKMI